MATAFNRTTHELMSGRDAEGLDPADWIILRARPKDTGPNPRPQRPLGIDDIKGLVGANLPLRYYFSDETDPEEPRFREMTGPEKDVEDSKTANANSDRKMNKQLLRNHVVNYMDRAYPVAESLQLLEALALTNGNPQRRALIESVLEWKQTVLAAHNVKIVEMDNSAMPIRVQVLDLSPFDATDPKVTVQQVLDEAG